MSKEAQEQRFREMSEYDSETTIDRMIAEGRIPDPDQFKQQQQQQNVEADTARRYNMVSSQEGYDKDVENAMLELVKTNLHWNSAVQTDEGALACFEFAKSTIAAEGFKSQAAELENARVKRSADAAKRSTPKSTTQTKTTATKPADNFANLGFEDKIGSIIDESLGL